MDTIDDAALLAKIEAFLSNQDMKPSRFGLEAMGDGALITGLRKGRSPSLKNVKKILAYMAQYERSVPAAVN